jgi:hypothetical protein
VGEPSIRLVGARAEFAVVLFTDRRHDDGEVILRDGGSDCIEGPPPRSRPKATKIR